MPLIGSDGKPLFLPSPTTPEEAQADPDAPFFPPDELVVPRGGRYAFHPGPYSGTSAPVKSGGHVLGGSIGIGNYLDHLTKGAGASESIRRALEALDHFQSGGSWEEYTGGTRAPSQNHAPSRPPLSVVPAVRLGGNVPSASMSLADRFVDLHDLGKRTTEPWLRVSADPDVFMNHLGIATKTYPFELVSRILNEGLVAAYLTRLDSLAPRPGSQATQARFFIESAREGDGGSTLLSLDAVYELRREAPGHPWRPHVRLRREGHEGELPTFGGSTWAHDLRVPHSYQLKAWTEARMSEEVAFPSHLSPVNPPPVSPDFSELSDDVVHKAVEGLLHFEPRFTRRLEEGPYTRAQVLRSFEVEGGRLRAAHAVADRLRSEGRPFHERAPAMVYTFARLHHMPDESITCFGERHLTGLSRQISYYERGGRHHEVLRKFLRGRR